MPSDWAHLRRVWLDHPTDNSWWAMYNAYLASPEWAAKRKHVLKRDKHRCRFCGDTERLEVHHPPHAYRDLGNENPDDLITICRRCHDPLTRELRRRRTEGSEYGRWVRLPAVGWLVGLFLRLSGRGR